jgi:TetR/AcrR family transcriptional regulator, transcriptional repressor of aconitase
MPKVSREHVEARRGQILEGARRAFARFGYEGATVPRLEREIGLSHGAIFSYYRSKLELFFELARADHARFEAVWAEEGFEALARAIAAEDPAWLGVYLEFHRLLRTDASIRRRWQSSRAGDDHAEEEGWLERERRAGRIRDDVPEEALFGLLHTLLDGLVLLRTSGAEIDVEPLVGLVRELLAPRP